MVCEENSGQAGVYLLPTITHRNNHGISPAAGDRGTAQEEVLQVFPPSFLAPLPSSLALVSSLMSTPTNPPTHSQAPIWTPHRSLSSKWQMRYFKLVDHHLCWAKKASVVDTTATLVHPPPSSSPCSVSSHFSTTLRPPTQTPNPNPNSNSHREKTRKVHNTQIVELIWVVEGVGGWKGW